MLHRQVLTPLDLERTYGLTGGHPSHGEMALDQLFLARPDAGLGAVPRAAAGLYMCGAGTHPGGGVTGGPARTPPGRSWGTWTSRRDPAVTPAAARAYLVVAGAGELTS